MFTFLLIVQTIVALAMVIVILMQRSEGGGLTGGSPSGLMTARGAADFLTRSTAILAVIFIALSIVLAALAASEGGPRQYETAPQPAAPATAPVPGAAPATAPGAAPATAPAAAAPATPQPAENKSGVPVAQ
jgi:preprotein translocase subunit SecG